jgi:hypothetical protein
MCPRAADSEHAVGRLIDKSERHEDALTIFFLSNMLYALCNLLCQDP